MSYLLDSNNKMKFYVEIMSTDNKANDGIARFIGKANVELSTDKCFPIGSVIKILRMGQALIGKVIYATHYNNSVLLSVRLIDAIN